MASSRFSETLSQNKVLDVDLWPSLDQTHTLAHVYTYVHICAHLNASTCTHNAVHTRTHMHVNTHVHKDRARQCLQFRSSSCLISPSALLPSGFVNVCLCVCARACYLYLSSLVSCVLCVGGSVVICRPNRQAHSTAQHHQWLCS